MNFLTDLPQILSWLNWSLRRKLNFREKLCFQASHQGNWELTPPLPSLPLILSYSINPWKYFQMQHIGSNGRKPGTGSDYSQSSFSMLDSGIQCWFTTLGYFNFKLYSFSSLLRRKELLTIDFLIAHWCSLKTSTS